MPLFGAHLSIAGGCHRALLEAQSRGFDTVQIFTKAPNQWTARPLDEEQVRLFRETLQETGLKYPTAHDSYLINLASPDETLYRKSIEAFVTEMNRAESLGLSYLVMHPGAHLSGTVEEGLSRVAQALDEVHARCAEHRVRVLIETTAGQGTTLGYRFEHLATILEEVAHPRRMGVCFDTCHVLAAGYGLSTEEEYTATMEEFDRVVGLKQIKAFHVNDSVKARGSRVDRHAHLGKGAVGLEGFRLLVNDERFKKLPMILETPKEEGANKDMDDVNLGVLRGLMAEHAP